MDWFCTVFQSQRQNITFRKAKNVIRDFDEQPNTKLFLFVQAKWKTKC